MVTDAEGEVAVRLAREAVEAYTRGRPMASVPTPASFDGDAGAFVTINTYPAEELRGCIGFPGPFFPLRDAIRKAAEESTEDPRFPKLAPAELDQVVVEVSVLTDPEQIVVRRPRDLVKRVRLGVDGLIVARGQARGLLLPNVPIDWGWDVPEFLSQTCVKAGLLPDAWLEPETRMYRFQTEIFTEVEPRGPVVRRVLAAHARA